MYSLPIFLGELMPNNDPMNFIFDQRCPIRSRDNHRSVEISSRELAHFRATPVHKIRFRKPEVALFVTCFSILNRIRNTYVTCKKEKMAMEDRRKR
ncbi:hypothetical protein WN51_07556 [Melipona quadrifasciata]|uniref:Uncharacterized protein n=1 Tax=Melipona quadrifasciata TaxID=166423 RepID=A0A0M9A7A6_9HYME|nr:hypothetical protein WN51_07556 [Melipona quadrifasciata]